MSYSSMASAKAPKRSRSYHFGVIEVTAWLNRTNSVENDSHAHRTLFAWFLELRSVAKQSARPIPPALGAKHHISFAGTRMKRHPLPSRPVRQPVLPSVERSFNKCKAY